MAIRKDADKNAILNSYSEIRSKYKGAAEGGSIPYAPVTDAHGFYLQRSNFLTERFAGLEKLFYTLIQGIVDDPDYAVRKDSKIYERMMRDPQIYYCLMVRTSAVSCLPWIVRPKAEMSQDSMAKRLAASAEKRLRKIPRFTELLDNIMDALLPGLSVNELVWKLDGGDYVVKDHYPVNKDRVKFDRNGGLYLLSPKAPTFGTRVPPYKFVCHTFNTTDGSWRRPETAGYVYYGRGLADTPLYHYFHFKMMALKFLLKELERYGMPFKIFYTGPQNAVLAEKLHEIMTALKNDAVVAIPGKKGETNVDIAKVATSKHVFDNFIKYVDMLITKSILGQELMTEMPAVGSYAAAVVHRSVFGLINTSDRARMKDTLDRTLLAYDSQLNTPNIKEELIPVFDFKKSPVEDTGDFLTMVALAQRLGLAISQSQIREYTGLREPTEGEKVLEPPAGQVEEEQIEATPSGQRRQTS